MLIKVNRKPKDLVEGPPHKNWTRRDFLKRGMATGALSVALPKLFGADLIQSAYAGTLTCPTPNKTPGAIAQVYSSGGAAMGARFISEAQAAIMNPVMASHYGISGVNPMKLGPGIVIDKMSPFGVTLLQGPPGFKGDWVKDVLGSICAGGHLGPFSVDDAVGANAGLMGSVSLDKLSPIGKDIYVNPTIPRAGWTAGTPAAYVSSFGTATPQNLYKSFSLAPAAASNTTAPQLKIAADGANAIGQALSTSFGTALRKGGVNLQTAGCAFYGNAAIADPTFATTLFDATQISALSGIGTLSAFSAEDLALSAAFYQSAVGSIGGVMLQLAGRDYHGELPQTIVPMEVEDARAIVMFLAACHAAQQPGALIYMSNGQCIGNGTVPVTATIDGVAHNNLNGTVPLGDAGGTYNAGMVIFYSPKGQSGLPKANYTYDSLDTTTGAVKASTKISSPGNGIAGLFLTAHKFINGGSLPNSLIKRLQAQNLAAIPNDLILFD